LAQAKISSARHWIDSQDLFPFGVVTGVSHARLRTKMPRAEAEALLDTNIDLALIGVASCAPIINKLVDCRLPVASDTASAVLLPAGLD